MWQWLMHNIFILLYESETILKGQVVWVTGASSGIGEELAYQLAKCGSRLILSARREDELTRVKRLCVGEKTFTAFLPISGLKHEKKVLYLVTTLLFLLQTAHIFLYIFQSHPTSRMKIFLFFHLICCKGKLMLKKQKQQSNTLGV